MAGKTDKPIPPHAPSACRTMAEVRGQIDRVDRALVRLVAERQGYIERAAEIKADRDRVRDQSRIEEVVTHVLAEAAKVGLSADIAEPVWRLLIERSIAYEFQIFDAKSQRSR